MGRTMELKGAGAAGLPATVVNVLAMFRFVKDMRANAKMPIIAFAVCAAFLFGDHPAMTVNFQPALVLSILIGKLTGGLCGYALAYRLCVPKALELERLELERLEQSQPATEESE
ncbi:MAG: ethanolamine utilization protein EutH [Planctomycetaceae bacterium]